jgi:hypothetical protein
MGPEWPKWHVEGCNRICYWNLSSFLTCGKDVSSFPQILQPEQRLLWMSASLSRVYLTGGVGWAEGWDSASLIIPVEERHGSVHFCLFLQTQWDHLCPHHHPICNQTFRRLWNTASYGHKRQTAVDEWQSLRWCQPLVPKPRKICGGPRWLHPCACNNAAASHKFSFWTEYSTSELESEPGIPFQTSWHLPPLPTLLEELSSLSKSEMGIGRMWSD